MEDTDKCFKIEYKIQPISGAVYFFLGFKRKFPLVERVVLAKACDEHGLGWLMIRSRWTALERVCKYWAYSFCIGLLWLYYKFTHGSRSIKRLNNHVPGIFASLFEVCLAETFVLQRGMKFCSGRIFSKILNAMLRLFIQPLHIVKITEWGLGFVKEIGSRKFLEWSRMFHCLY